MIPWRPLFVFLGISVGAAMAVAVLSAAMGWSVHSPAWGVLAPIVMWAPALGRLAARRTVDRGFTSPVPLSTWGVTGLCAQAMLWPLAVPLAVYGAAYAIAWSAGVTHWNPGGGRWTTGPQIAVNLLVNLSILGVFGTFTALGEEIGWRGYLQPRLDAAGVRGSVAVVWLCQLAYHAPLMAGAGYANAGGFFASLALFAAGSLSVTFLWARQSYRARSLWPAVLFHSFHNTISQWLFPRLFTVSPDQPWLRGEMGLLPMLGYIVLGTSMYAWMRLRGHTWESFSREALVPSTL